MLDLFHIPSNTDSTKIFYAQGATAWQTWEKPRNAKFIQIFCLGGGASGGSGVRGTNGSTRAGAGGGGSGGIARALYPAFLLPDTLYIQVGAGGAFIQGTATGTTGNAGGISYVSMSPTTTAISVIAQSSTATSLGGASTAAATTNAGGAAATIWTTTSAPFTSLGVLNLVAGVAGGISTNANTGVIVNVQALGTNIVTGGGGGGGNNQSTAGSFSATAGASVLSASVILVNTVPGGLTGSLIGTGNPGGNGYGSLSPLCGTGGAGGSGQASGSFSGGNGGNAAYGCGGGGGGAATITTGIGGSGGKGGDGLVIITTIF
jgi:hypothetical protein